MKIYQSFGGGVQSWALALLAVTGKIAKPEAVIYAKTFDSIVTREYIEKYKHIITDAGIRYVEVSASNLVPVDLSSTFKTPVPLFVLNKDNKVGMLQRSCTKQWKIDPVTEFIKSEVDVKELKRNKQKVQLRLGISIDEFSRVSQSKIAWLENQYPLLDLYMARDNCEDFILKELGELPPKSSCVFCPFRSKNNRQFTREEDIKVLEDFSAKIKQVQDPKMYLTANEAKENQNEILDNVEELLCEGYCMV